MQIYATWLLRRLKANVQIKESPWGQIRNTTHYSRTGHTHKQDYYAQIYYMAPAQIESECSDQRKSVGIDSTNTTHYPRTAYTYTHRHNLHTSTGNICYMAPA